MEIFEPILGDSQGHVTTGLLSATQYLKDNFYISTSGNFHTPTLVNVIVEMGADRVLFAVDYPYERTDEAVRWFDACAISEEHRQKIAHGNAVKLFKLTS